MGIIKASDSPYREMDVVSTGISSLDKVLGLGGVPFRRITEISGPYSVGKTTLALMIVSEAQKKKKECLWTDIEFAWDERYATTLGVDIRKLNLLQEELAETALDEIEDWAKKKKNSVIVIDAVGALLPRAEAEKGNEGKTIGAQAGLVAKFLRKVVPLLAINNHALVVLNHQFQDIMTGRLKTSGGAKLEYHRSIWLSLRKGNKRIMQGENKVGEIVEAEIRKNKVASTMGQKIEMSMIYGHGFSKEADLIQEALDKAIIVKKGQFYFIGEEKIARGQTGLRELFKDESFACEIKEKLSTYSQDIPNLPKG